MKIYFAGSITGGRDDQALYLEIIELLREHGEVVSEFIGEAALTHMGSQRSQDETYRYDISLIDQADWIVAEVTTPSLGVGYELGYGEAYQKKILCIYRPREGRMLSAMVAGNPNLTVKQYQTTADAAAIFDELLK